MRELADGISVFSSPLNKDLYFVAGNHSDEYSRYLQSKGSEYTAVENNDAGLIYVKAADIEGINMSEHDITSFDDSFWGKSQDETKDTFMTEITEYYPKVRELVDGGMSYDDIIFEYPEYESCVNIYYRNPVELSAGGDAGEFYEFTSNGRHRTIASLLLDRNIEIPVRIRHIIRKKENDNGQD